MCGRLPRAWHVHTENISEALEYAECFGAAIASETEKGCGETAMATTICPLARRPSFLFHCQQHSPTQHHSSSSSWSVVPAAQRLQWPIQLRTGADRSSCLPIRAESTSTSGQVNAEFGVPAAVQEKNNVVETRLGFELVLASYGVLYVL